MLHVHNDSSAQCKFYRCILMRIANQEARSSTGDRNPYLAYG